MVKSLAYGGFWIRFLAYIIDAVILFAIAGLLFGDSCPEAGNYCASYEGPSAIIPLAYLVGFWTWKGATPGKMICKLRIVDMNGGPIKFTTALLRLLGYFVSTIVILIGFIMIAFDPKKQGLHDKIAKTYVVKL